MLRRKWSSVLATGVVLSLASSTAYAGASPGSDGVGDPAYPQDGNGGYQVTHYDVKIDYDPAKPDFLIGDTSLEATATQNLSRFDLDLEGFEVGSVTVNGKQAAFTRSGEHELVITPAKAIANDAHFVVRVKYQGTPGLFWMTADDAGAVHAFAEPHSASSWYPVNDHPSDKATFRLGITLPDRPGWGVVGNGVPSPPTVAQGKKTFVWTESRPVASYLTGVVIDKLTTYTKTLADGTKVIDAYTAGAEKTSKAQEDRLPEVMTFLTRLYGRYPFPTVGGIFYPGAGDSGGFELQERPIYSGGVSAKYFTVIVHEVAHQWFGNSVSVKQWKDICLKECFASYTEWLWNEAKEGRDLDADYRQKVQESKADPDFWKYPLADPGDGFYGGSYTVGPMMLHALRRTVGDAAFFATLKTFVRLHQYGNASFADFEQLAQQVSHRNLTGFFKAWAHSTTQPADEYLELKEHK